MIPAEDLQKMQAGQQKMKDSFSSIPPEVLDCITSSLGADVVEKMKTGSVIGRKDGDAINQCFQKFGVQERRPDKNQNNQDQQDQNQQGQQNQPKDKFQPGPGTENPGGQQMPQRAGPKKVEGQRPQGQPCEGENCQDPPRELQPNQSNRPEQGDTNSGPGACGTGPGTCSGIGPDDINPRQGGQNQEGPSQGGQQGPPPSQPSSSIGSFKAMISEFLQIMR